MCTEVIQSAQGMEYLLGETTTAVTLYLPIIPNIHKSQDQPRHTISSSTFIPAPRESSVKQTGQVFWLSASYFCTHSLSPSGFNELYVLKPTGAEHRTLLERRKKPLKLFDPALEIVTGDRAGHSGSDRRRLVLQSRVTILGCSNGFSVTGDAGNGTAGLLFLLFGSLNTHTQAVFALQTNPVWFPNLIFRSPYRTICSHSVINIHNIFYFGYYRNDAKRKLEILFPQQLTHSLIQHGRCHI